MPSVTMSGHIADVTQLHRVSDQPTKRWLKAIAV